MTTEETIASPLYDGVAATGAGAPIWSSATLPWRLAEVAAAGALAGVLMIFGWLDLRADLPVAAAQSFFWIKAGYPLAVAGFALAAATRLARRKPGGGLALAAAGAVACAMLAAGGFEAASHPGAALAALIWTRGATCLANVLLIAAPMLALVAAGLRQVELDRPALTGAASGLFCGGVAAAVDGLHCTEGTYAFVGPWFALAMLLVAAIGAMSAAALSRGKLLAAE